MVRTFHTESGFLYCERCGLPTEVVQRQDGHDPETGQPNMLRFRRCPKAGWRGLWSHTDQRVYVMGPRPRPVRPHP